MDKVELIHFRQGPALWNNVEAPKVSHDRATDSFCELAQNERLPHRPDAFFTLRFTDRSGEKQDAHFFYEVMIARFHAMLEMACRARSDKVELIHFRQGPALWNNVEAPKVSHDRATDSFCELAQNERLPHRPDAFFTLRFTDRSGEKQDAHFFYEADRKHTSTPKFNRKLRAHFHYIVKQKKHWEQYGVDRIRAVLIETTDGHWAETLRSAAQHPLVSGNKPSPLFWFTPSTLFTRVAPTTDSASKRAAPLFLEKPGIIFERIWATPADDTLHSLLD